MRRHTLLILALGGLAAGCGDTQGDRETTGALSGAAMGAIVGGPIGAIVGAGAGYLTGNKLDKSADQKVEELIARPGEPSPAPSTPPPPTVVPTAATAPAPSEPASGAPERGNALTQAQIEEKLHAAGYKPVHAIRRDGPAYVARGERNGTLYDVRVEAATGQLMASREIGIVRKPRNGGASAAMMTEQQIRTTLRQSGYEMVGDVARDGDRYRAEAMQGGRMYDLVVDGRTGQVVNSAPATATGAPAPPQGG
jgi:hypothetical protein